MTSLTWQQKLLPTQANNWVKYMAYAIVIANIGLIISGGIVRLTGSGLGCDAWPRCTSEGSWTTTPEMGIHGVVEFANRLLTFVLTAITVLTFLSIVRLVLPEMGSFKELLPKLLTGLRASQHRYADLFNLTLLLLWGIPLQAVVGGVSVWLKLNPWMITAHYYLSAIMIALASIYLNRVLRYFFSQDQQRKELEVHDLAASSTLKFLGLTSLLLLAFLVFMGTVTTGTGPHAGDPAAHRHAFDPWLVTRMHSLAVWAYALLTLASFLLLKKYAWPASMKRQLAYLAVVMLFQGLVGYLQFFNGLPVWLVELHLIGSGLFIWAATALGEKQLVLASKNARAKALARISLKS